MYRYHPYYTPIKRPYPPTPIYPHSFTPPYYYRDFPPVQPQIFMDSSKKMLVLMKSAEMVLEKTSKSDSFSSKLMEAAQQSNKSEVERLLYSTGIQAKPEIDFNPDGINLLFKAQSGQSDCCYLTLKLRWRDL